MRVAPPVYQSALSVVEHLGVVKMAQYCVSRVRGESRLRGLTCCADGSYIARRGVEQGRLHAGS